MSKFLRFVYENRGMETRRFLEQDSTRGPNFAFAHLFPLVKSCWGWHPRPAFDRRFAPVLWRCRATKIRQPRPLRSRLTGRKTEAVSAFAAERHTSWDTTKVDRKTH